MLLNLYPHQLDAANRLRNGYILKGGVGSGKSRTALYYYYTKVLDGQMRITVDGLVETGMLAQNEFVPPTKVIPLYVITPAKKRDSGDWTGEASNFAIYPESDWIPITVDSWNNIKKYEDVTDAFFIFDEQRLVGSGAWVKSFLKIAKSNQWILLTATPADTWMDYIPVMVANGFYKNRTEFVRRHVVLNYFKKYPVIDHFVDTGVLERRRRKITVDMKHILPAEHCIEWVECDYDKSEMDVIRKDRWNTQTNKPFKDISELFRSARTLSNSDESRLWHVREILAKKKKIIIFYNFDYELEILRGLSDSYIVAEWNGHKHEPTPTGDEWVYLVQYQAGSEAWNCITTDTVIFYSMSYSYRITKQAMGRIDRLNTPYKTLYYYFLHSGSWIDKAIRRALLCKQDFNERDYEREEY